jgi:hypothetical protein
MISQSDVAGRLRLFRYGLVVLVVVTFLVALLVPYASLRTSFEAAGLPQPGIFDNLGWAVIATVVVAVLSVILYFVYQNVLQRTTKSS